MARYAQLGSFAAGSVPKAVDDAVLLAHLQLIRALTSVREN